MAYRQSDIALIINYVVEKQDFPEKWSIGIQSVIHKAGVKTNVDNYRGVKILPIMEKVFETAVYRRLSCVNELLGEVDPYNGGLLTGVRTTHNLFILQGLNQRQLILGKTLYVCLINFSKAFDMINRNISFQKLMNGSWQGRVVQQSVTPWV